MNQQSSLQTRQAKTQQAFKNIQAINLVFYDIMERAFAVFGFPKAAKTTTCHLLSNSPLVSQDVDGELLYTQHGQAYKSATVDHSFQPHTLIPNIFRNDVLQNGQAKSIYLIDMPGYANNLGFYRMFGTAYVGYRMFTKTPKLKFILIAQVSDIKHNIQKFISLIRNFYRTFENGYQWNIERKKILRATCLFITKVEPNTQAKQLVEKIKKLRIGLSNMKNDQRQNYQQFIDEVVNQQKVFLIYQPNKPQQQINYHQTLQKVYDKTDFWQRPHLNKKFIDVSLIKYNISNQLQLRTLDKEDSQFVQQIIDYLQSIKSKQEKVVTNSYGSLVNIVKLLQIEIMQNSKESKIFDNIRQLAQSFNYHDAYKQKRLLAASQLFKNSQNSLEYCLETVQEQHATQVIKKIKILEQLSKIGQKLQRQLLQPPNQQWMPQFQDAFCCMISKLMGLSLDNVWNVFCNFNYMIHNIMQQELVFDLIIFQRTYQILSPQLSYQYSRTQPLFRLFYDRLVVQTLGQINMGKIKNKFLSNLNCRELPLVNYTVIVFLQQCSIDTTADSLKIAEGVLLLAENQLKPELRRPQYQLRRMIKFLYKYRNKCFTIWQDFIAENKTGQNEVFDSVCSLIVELTSQLSHALQIAGMPDQAQICYRQTNNMDIIKKTYELQFKLIIEQSISELNELEGQENNQIHYIKFVEYGQEALANQHKILAISCFKKAYYFSSNADERQWISKLISKCQKQEQKPIQIKKVTRFLKRQKEFRDLPSSLKQKIQQLLQQ